MSTERDRQTTGSIGSSRRGFLAGAAAAAGGLLIGSPGPASATSAAPADSADPVEGRIVPRSARRGTRAGTAAVTIVRDDIRTYAQDAGRLQTFKDAMQQLKNRPDSNPTSFGAQAILHASHCGGGPNAPTQIHYGARFLPWHRAFLYYFERLLQAAVNEPTLTLPYWNWTDQLTIPQPYWDAALMPIAPRTQRALGTRPLSARRTAINTILATPDFQTFGGGAQGDGGNLEFGPHGYVHNTVGGAVGWMSDIQYSPRDPVFYAHHANIDRVWYLWMLDLSHHNEVNESDRYTFVDTSGQPVEISVGEILQWDIRYNEMPRVVSVPKQNTRVTTQTHRTTFSIPAGALPSAPVVERSPATLQLENVVLPGNAPVTVDVFMEAAGAAGTAGSDAGLVGSVSIVPVGDHHQGTVDVHLSVPAALAPLLRSGRNLQVRIEPVNENGVPTGELAFEGFTLELH